MFKIACQRRILVGHVHYFQISVQASVFDKVSYALPLCIEREKT